MTLRWGVNRPENSAISAGSRALATLLLVLGALLLPASAAALDHGEPFRIGALTMSWGPTPSVVSMRKALVEMGYRENEQFVTGVRFTQGNTAELYEAARVLIADGVDILFTVGEDAAMAAQRTTARIPKVFTAASDPVELGLIKSYARPGGNITGFTDRTMALNGKRLQIFRELIPGLRRVMFLYDSESFGHREQFGATRDAARRMRMVLVERPVRSEAEVKQALDDLKIKDVHGVLAPWDTNFNIPGYVLEAGKKQRIPTMFASAFLVEAGGLASYGPSLRQTGAFAARLIEKIMKGTRPADIPVEVNSEVELVINLKAAKAMGLKIPPEVLYRADRIIR